MKASSNNLLSIIKGPRQFVIPIYQRTYSWQLVQCNQLLNDILRISNDSAVQGNFIGSIVYFQESIHTVSDVPKLLVIDGQQRLTTVSLLIAAIADFIKENAVEIDTSFTKLQNYYLINPEEDNELRYKLLLTRRDKDTYINLLKGIPRSEGMSQRITENYDFFKSKINKENVVAIYSGVQRLFVVDVALEKEKDNPQLIFESMNSTGLDLSQADLIRNYVLMGQEVHLQTSLYESYWYPMEQGYGSEYAALFNSFMRDYLSVKTGTIPRIDMVYDAFKAYVIGGKAPDTISEVVKDIYTYSGYYVNMVLHKEPDKLLCGAFKRISQLRVDVSYPFLLPLYNDYVNEVISRDEFYEALCLVENYVFRRAICGIPTNSLNKTFATLYKSFDKANYMDGLKAAFLLLDSYKRFPNDTEFTTFLQTKDVYNFRNRNYLLNRLENFQRKEMVNISDYTIEHVMPQNPNLSHEWQEMLGEGWVEVQGKYLHTLGNLTLTGYNSELSDRPFQEKKSMEGGFDDSPIRLNSYLRRISSWNEEQILVRAGQLAEKAKEIWRFPLLSPETLEVYRSAERDPAEYTLEHYEYLKGDILTLFQALRRRIMNIDPSVKEELKKLYIAFKAYTNFVDVVPQKSRLRLSLNVAFADILDPKGLCKDVSNLGRWGNGDVEVGISNMNELDDIMELIQQAFDKQMEAN